MALSLWPRDLGALTRGDLRERWRDRVGSVASLDTGLHLFAATLGAGVGVATLLGLTGPITGLVYGLSLLLLSATATVGLVALLLSQQGRPAR